MFFKRNKLNYCIINHGQLFEVKLYTSKIKKNKSANIFIITLNYFNYLRCIILNKVL